MEERRAIDYWLVSGLGGVDDGVDSGITSSLGTVVSGPSSGCGTGSGLSVSSAGGSGGEDGGVGREAGVDSGSGGVNNKPSNTLSYIFGSFTAKAVQENRKSRGEFLLIRIVLYSRSTKLSCHIQMIFTARYSYYS